MENPITLPEVHTNIARYTVGGLRAFQGSKQSPEHIHTSLLTAHFWVHNTTTLESTIARYRLLPGEKNGTIEQLVRVLENLDTILSRFPIDQIIPVLQQETSKTTDELTQTTSENLAPILGTLQKK